LFGFKHFPLQNHSRAVPAAIAAFCAGEQQSFWPFFDVLFRNGPSRLDDVGLRSAAEAVALNVAEWSNCLNADSAAARVKSELAEAVALRLSGTPAFVVGLVSEGAVRATRVLGGVRPIQEFESAILEAEKHAASAR
jgi:protein-disulfide isomerase